jgi:excisionase family DNA binding protein
MTRMLLDVREVGEALGCGKTYVYELIGRGELRAIKLGRLTRVPLSAIEEFVNRKVIDSDSDAEAALAHTRAIVVRGDQRS